MPNSSDSPIVVCLGYPAVATPAHFERLRSIDPRIEPVALPVDADGDWMNVDTGIAHEEPPPWALGCRDERRRALPRSGVLIALVYTMVLIPAILALWPMRQHPRFGLKQHSGGFDRLLTGIADFATSNARGIVIVSLGLMGLAVVGLFSLRFSMNFVEWIPKTV